MKKYQHYINIRGEVLPTPCCSYIFVFVLTGKTADGRGESYFTFLCLVLVHFECLKH